MISLRSPVAREWIARQRESIRPWNSFIDQEKFSKPQTPAQISDRLQKNVKFFQSNYLVVVLVLAGYCLITSPMLIIALAAFFGVQFVQIIWKSCWKIFKKTTVSSENNLFLSIFHSFFTFSFYSEAPREHNTNKNYSAKNSTTPNNQSSVAASAYHYSYWPVQRVQYFGFSERVLFWLEDTVPSGFRRLIRKKLILSCKKPPN